MVKIERIRALMRNNINYNDPNCRIPTAGGRSHFYIIDDDDTSFRIKARNAQNPYRIKYDRVQVLWDSRNKLVGSISVEDRVQRAWNGFFLPYSDSTNEVYCLGIVFHLQRILSSHV